MGFSGQQHKFVPEELSPAEDALSVDILERYEQTTEGCPRLAVDCCTLRIEGLGIVAEMVSSEMD